MSLLSFLSQSTCGESCWHATEDVCRCSCGGRNHGCLRGADGDKPIRTAKLDGYVYELRAVGHRDVYAEAQAINKAAGYRETLRITDSLSYHYPWVETDPGAPARVKSASASQCERWPELSAFRGQDSRARYFDTPYLLWVRMEPAKAVAA